MTKISKYNCGYVAIVGRPNVGKSTILNKLLGKKVSITSDKPETTQKQILGIKTTSDYQIIFVDTPGLHEDLYKQQKNILTKYMGRAARQALLDVDLILFVIQGNRWQEADQWVLNMIKEVNIHNKIIPVALVINKTDLIGDKKELLPFVESIKDKYNFAEIFYISALKQKGLVNLEKEIVDYIPEVPSADQFLFEQDRITDQSNKAQVAEIIREKIIRLFGAEVPYSIAIEIEEFAEDETNQNLLNIAAIIWVARAGQKVIIIGSKGEKIKEVGKSARIDLERLFNKKIYLQLWVKVKANWSDSERALKSLGFNDFE